MPISTSSIRDNRSRGTVADFLRDKIKADSKLSFVSAYFTIYAYDRLKATLDGIDSLRFLFGEPRFVSAIDPDRTDKKAFEIEDNSIALANRTTQRAVAKACAEWIRDKAEIRSIRKPGFLHGKLYHVDPPGQAVDALVGSSNFTVAGIGEAGAANNVELNLVVNDRRDLEELHAWFDELWNNAELVEDVKQQVLDYLEQLYADNAPEFVYFKTLYHLFEDYLREQEKGDLLDERIGILDTHIWKALFEFQKDGVKGAINKILRHNGCILADSVGLGKTFEALAVIKYFELRNERVLVLCPKKLEENWTLYRNNDLRNPLPGDRFQYDVLAHTDLSRSNGKAGQFELATFNWGNYNLVVIDESHNFRNDTRGKDGRKSRYERLMEDVIRAGVKTKVLLLSATPVNNDLGDLRNQLYIATEGRDDAFADSLGVPSLRNTMQGAQQTFLAWAKKKGARNTNELLETLSAAFFKLLDELTIARSRHHIRAYYPEAYAKLGGFPAREKPAAVYPDIDLEQDKRQRFMSYDQLSAQIDKYKLVVFNPRRYVLPEHEAKYDEGKVANFSQAQRESYLIGMMKVNFLKRLESSVHAFAITMQRTIEKIEQLQERIVRFKEFAAENPDVDFEALTIEDQDDDELAEALEVGQKLVYKMAHLDVDKWLADLAVDKSELQVLLRSAQRVDANRDAKLADLKARLTEKITHPTQDKTGQANRKALVFTAFADTAKYIYSELHAWATAQGIHIALVTGSASDCQTTFGDHDFNSILTHFSPRSKNRAAITSLPQNGQIDLLIATDCISEGQNLQDCDLVVNYDIHWNPVRIIQRFGRIDRIGSVNSSVGLVNYWPTADLDHYVKLKSRVEARMALVDVTATNTDNMLAENIQELVQEDLRYRDKQLLRLKDEVLDLEDFNESVTLSEFTLDDFRIELARFIEASRERLRNAPLGLHAVVPPTGGEVVQPGVIFCLRRKATSPLRPSPIRGGVGGGVSSDINPLDPYYLVYVRDDGEVRFGFSQPKQILTMYGELCKGKTTIYEALCRQFDQRTHDGADMAHYDALLAKTVQSIAGTFTKRAAQTLTNSRSAVLPVLSEQATEQTDYELITWLVILQ
jgi:superfamily II DNA or RNA helicase